MSRLGDRHSGGLDGRLQSGGTVTVAVILDEPADAVADQHTGWMLINLLTRLEGVVEKVLVVAPDANLLPRVCPLARSRSFPTGLVDAANAIEGVPVIRAATSEDAAVLLHVGAGPKPERGWRVAGNAWTATFAMSGVAAAAPRSSLPFGPYAAACLAASEVFRAVCLVGYEPVTAISFDLWSQVITPNPGLAGAGPLEVDVRLDFGLAGVGAVGVGLLHTLWACGGVSGRGVIADSDPDGVDITNLNRCVLFDRRHLGRPKATTAAAVYGAGQLNLEPIDGRYDRDNVSPAPRVLLSAVDANDSRHALQQGFAPGVALGASTQGLRAEVVHLGPPAQGPCLGCFNPLDDQVPDDVRRSAIRQLEDCELAAQAERIGSDPERLRAWAVSGDCALISAEALGHLTAEDEPPAMFSVGFVSVMAGVMLAVELVREVAATGPAGAWQSVKFQLHRPDAERNGRPRRQPPDPTCPICSDDIHVGVWRRHHAEARPEGGAIA